MCKIAAVVLLLPLSTGAATLRDVEVDRVDGVYTLQSQVWFDAGIEQTYAVFRDWDLSTRFSSVVVESRNLEPDETGRPGFYNRNRACIWFYCQTFERYGWVDEKPLEFIEATADPERSDFHLSVERWEFVAEDQGTLVKYRLEMRPKFFIPPLIGPALVKRKLKKGSGDAIDRIERLAQEQTVDAY